MGELRIPTDKTEVIITIIITIVDIYVTDRINHNCHLC